MEIHPKFFEWALERIEKPDDTKKETDNLIEVNQQAKIAELELELSGLRSMNARKMITDEEFLKDQTRIKKQIADLTKIVVPKLDKRQKIILDKKTFTFCAYAYRDYEEASKEGKRELLTQLGSNREILNKNVVITPFVYFMPIAANANGMTAELNRLEPEKFGYDYTKNEALNALRLRWLWGLGSNQRNPR